MFVVELLLLLVALWWLLLLFEDTEGSGVMNDERSLGGPPFMCFVDEGVTDVFDTVETFSGWDTRFKPRADRF